MKVDVVAHLQAKPGCESALRTVLESLVVPTRHETGCLRYDLHVDLDDPTKLTFIQEWDSREDLLSMGSRHTLWLAGVGFQTCCRSLLGSKCFLVLLDENRNYED